MKGANDPTAEPWWEVEIGSTKAFVLAAGPDEAREKAEVLMRDLGVLPGGPPRLHESFGQMCEFGIPRHR